MARRPVKRKTKSVDFNDPKWNAHREELEEALIKSCREFIKHTGSPSFKFEIKGWLPKLFLVCGTPESIQSILSDETLRES